MTPANTLRAVAGLFVLGGIVRLVANQAVFSVFGIGPLWPDAAYSLCIAGVVLLLIRIAPRLGAAGHTGEAGR